MGLIPAMLFFVVAVIAVTLCTFTLMHGQLLMAALSGVVVIISAIIMAVVIANA